ncbi:carbohydrate-binding module family 48 protein, partial [Sistotremastrum suecicum HHB10207 ss-3]
EADHVMLTGTFDNWSKSIPLKKTDNGFQGTVKVPWGSTVFYKFLVDDVWSLNETQPTAVDPIGNVNNVFVVPMKP